MKFAQFERTKSEIRPVRMGIESYLRQSPTDVVSSKTISDTLKHLSRNVGGRKNAGALSISRLAIMSRRIPNLLVNATEAQLKSVVAMQAETALPFRLENTIFDYHHIRRLGESLSIELIAAKREDVQR